MHRLIALSRLHAFSVALSKKTGHDNRFRLTVRPQAHAGRTDGGGT